jgi:hypothetical protein
MPDRRRWNSAREVNRGRQVREEHDMASYDPETLNVMRHVLDQAWALLPEDRKNKFMKIDMADRILRKAAAGERDPAKLQAAALVGTAPEQADDPRTSRAA